MQVVRNTLCANLVGESLSKVQWPAIFDSIKYIKKLHPDFLGGKVKTCNLHG